MGDSMPKQSKNLSLDSEAIERGERYSELHQTNVSQLVGNFLSSLPLEEEKKTPLSPAVRRLFGVAAGDSSSQEYRQYLSEKYGK
jgi:hypothetical protein